MPIEQIRRRFPGQLGIANAAGMGGLTEKGSAVGPVLSPQSHRRRSLQSPSKRLLAPAVQQGVDFVPSNDRIKGRLQCRLDRAGARSRLASRYERQTSALRTRPRRLRPGLPHCRPR